VRGILIVNPRATTMSRNTPELVTRSLAGLVDLDVQRTERRGHARELAAATDADLVLVLGGDGAVNEAVNGIMARPTGRQEPAGPERPVGPAKPGGPARSEGPARPEGPEGPVGPARPLIGVIPGGGGNVFARALGLPLTTEAAVGRIRDVIAAESYRTIGLGLAGDRYFTFSADLGWDAEVMHEMDELREAGRRQSTALYLRTIARQYYRGTDRRVPALTLERDGQPPVDGLFMTIVTNRSPWTYFGGRALLPMPNPDFSSGLDLLALRRLRVGTIVSAVSQLLWVRGRPPRGRYLLSVPGLPSLVIRSSRPIAFQVDGEYLGETKAVEFRFVPDAIRVVA
jgi:diacylglycerol kinase family enzyme